MNNIIKHTEQPIIVRPDELSVEDVIAQVKKIKNIMDAVMKKDEHYGIIPGTPKPTLLKPGAEKLCLTFRLDPQYESQETIDGHHLTVKSKCVLYHIPSGMRLGSGEGSCSTKESKYAYRESRRLCPHCGKDAIIKGKEEYGGGWLCFGKKGGCGAKFKADDAVITTQVIGRVPNEDIADQYNTILKMSNKRSLIAAVLNVTAASDIFTQDLEDLSRREEAFEASKPSMVVDKETGEILEPKKDGVFNPATEVANSRKHPDKTWAQLPHDYLDWMAKNAKGAELKKKAIATIKWLKMQEDVAPLQTNVVDEMFPSVQESAVLFDELCSTLNNVAHEYSENALSAWAKDNELKIKRLKEQEKIVLRKAFIAAVAEAKKVSTSEVPL